MKQIDNVSAPVNAQVLESTVKLVFGDAGFDMLLKTYEAMDALAFSSYLMGLEDGEEDGYDAGFNDGHLEGFNYGKSVGYDEAKDVIYSPRQPEVNPMPVDLDGYFPAEAYAAAVKACQVDSGFERYVVSTPQVLR